MKCSIQGCPGQLEAQRISHTLQRGPEILVFEHVPAEVCSVCGDILLAPVTIRHMEKLLDPKPIQRPSRMAPVYEYGYA